MRREILRARVAKKEADAFAIREKKAKAALAALKAMKDAGKNLIKQVALRCFFVVVILCVGCFV